MTISEQQEMSDDTSNTDTHNSIVMVTDDFRYELNNHFSFYEKITSRTCSDKQAVKIPAGIQKTVKDLSEI